MVVGLAVAKGQNTEAILRAPDDLVKRLSATRCDLSDRVLEAPALEREQTLTLYQVSEMLGVSRVETEDFLGQHFVPPSVIGEAELDRDAAILEAASRRRARQI
jgi:hypothetical protein